MELTWWSGRIDLVFGLDFSVGRGGGARSAGSAGFLWPGWSIHGSWVRVGLNQPRRRRANALVSRSLQSAWAASRSRVRRAWRGGQGGRQSKTAAVAGGLLVISVAAGMAVMQALFEAEIAEVAGPERQA